MRALKVGIAHTQREEGGNTVGDMLLVQEVREDGSYKLINGMIATGIKACPICDNNAYVLKGGELLYCHVEDDVFSFSQWKQAMSGTMKKHSKLRRK